MDLQTSHWTDELLEQGALRTLYQPIIELDSGAVAAFEALTRGPAGGPLEQPDQLFRAAAAAGRAAALDRACFDSAIRRADRHVPGTVAVFVNVEPSTLTSELVDRTAPMGTAGERQIVLEVTERALATDPGRLIAGVAAARERGWLIALDDVGVDPVSLAFLPILRPDIIKLDMGLIQGRPGPDLGRTMAAVMAHAERSGATVLAEGIEDGAHLERAISLGATLGQGYRFGRPAERHPAVERARLLAASAAPVRAVERSPFDAIERTGRPLRVARKDVLLQISRHIEEQALVDPGAPLLLSAFQEARHFTGPTAARYVELAQRCALVGALGVAMEREPATGVRGATIHAGDPLDGEWSVVALGAHYAAALLGKDLGDVGCPDGDRRFSYVVTHDRSAVELAADSLLRRISAPR